MQIWWKVSKVRILAVIPARGGSKSIPKKNIRLLHGKPLIYYAIHNALESRYITDVTVSTDSLEIADVVQQYGVEVILRDHSLATDMITLDPVVYDAVKKSEFMKKPYDIILTLQPTSPLLSVKTLDKSIEYFLAQGLDTLLSVVNRPHLSWGEKDGEFVPQYEERKNRQQLPPQYFETGAFVIAKRECIKPNSRIGKKISMYEIPQDESLDIDDKNDWILAESLMKKKKIILRADGFKNLGMGHIYNCITLAYSLIEHDVVIVTQKDATEGIHKLKETNLPYKVFCDQAELETFIEAYRPDIFVHDCLNTTEEYISWLKNRVHRVVTIEDLGPGRKKADAVINALYDEDLLDSHIYNGWKYVCLREEFQLEKPRKYSNEVKSILIMFGGTDPANLNKLLYSIIEKISYKYENIRFVFIIGIGYQYKQNGVITQENKNIFVYPNVARVTKYMKEADLAITSQGRTIFELAAMGVPAIVLSQNEREKTHKFAQMENGFLNLGMGNTVEAAVIENTLDWLIHTPEIRRNMYSLLMKHDLRPGLHRVKQIILGEEDE